MVIGPSDSLVQVKTFPPGGQQTAGVAGEAGAREYHLTTRRNFPTDTPWQMRWRGARGSRVLVNRDPHRHPQEWTLAEEWLLDLQFGPYEHLRRQVRGTRAVVCGDRGV